LFAKDSQKSVILATSVPCEGVFLGLLKIDPIVNVMESTSN